MENEVLYKSNYDVRNRLGVILPFSADFSNYFIVILDENNKLWYASKKVLNNREEIKAFDLVFFRYDEENNVIFLNNYFSNFYSTSVPTFYSLSPQNRIIAPLPKNVLYPKSGSSKFVRKYGISNQYYLTSIDFIDNIDNILKKRFFLIDIKDSSYREIIGPFLTYITYSLGERGQSILPIDGTEIKEICDLVNNFNPYEVFESYIIDIRYHTKERLDREDIYSEYKCYSINYIDDYLSKWFMTKRIKLFQDEGYTFNTINAYQRFTEEENKAKKRAYAEYNKQEHFDCLMAKYYSILEDRYKKSKIGDSSYDSYKWLPNYPNVSEAYNLFYKYLNDIDNILTENENITEKDYEIALDYIITNINRPMDDFV